MLGRVRVDLWSRSAPAPPLGQARYSTDPATARLGETPHDPRVAALGSSKRPIVVDDVLEEDWARSRAGRSSPAADVRSAVDIPLRRGGQLVAALWFNSPEPRRWTTHEVRMLTGDGRAARRAALRAPRKREQRTLAGLQLLRRDAILEAVSVDRGAAARRGQSGRTAAPSIPRADSVRPSVRAAPTSSRTGRDPTTGWTTSQRFEWVAAGIDAQLGNKLMQELPLADVGLDRFERVVGSNRVFTAVVAELPECELPALRGPGDQPLLVSADRRRRRLVGLHRLRRLRRPSASGGATESETLRLAASLVAAAIQQRPSETTLREHEQKLRAVFEASLDAIVVMDDSRHLVDVNSAACELLEAGKGRSARAKGSTPPSRPSELATCRRGAGRRSGAEAAPIENRLLQRSDGAVRAGRGARFGRTSSRACTFFISATSASGSELEAELLAAQKLEAIGRLAGGVAHDFNNMLLAIGGNGELALDALTNGEDASRGRRARCVAAAERAASLTTQLLAFSRRQVLQPRSST